MFYKILYTSWYGGQRKIAVFNFKKGIIIEFTIDELEKQELEKDLVQYISGLRERIQSGYWDYSL
ncbi:hypothetical protein [Calidifontibacillus oryziterrae]|uniref:hypothetical protein n=1 Tax=Calidifontibacillus oryziterrae TaxID=1191699 RepID=UPI000309C783|nr:hypothetical protein [Calidifontibacillus oryziterrae]